MCARLRRCHSGRWGSVCSVCERLESIDATLLVAILKHVLPRGYVANCAEDDVVVEHSTPAIDDKAQAKASAGVSVDELSTEETKVIE